MRNTLSILTAAAISAAAFVPALAATPAAPAVKAPQAQSKIMKSNKKSVKTFSKKRTSIKKARK